MLPSAASSIAALKAFPAVPLAAQQRSAAPPGAPKLSENYVSYGAALSARTLLAEIASVSSSSMMRSTL